MLTEKKRAVLERFAEGRRYYKLMNFIEAQRAFGEGLKADPDDRPSKIYFERCKHYIENPPPDDWDGVFIMKTK
jgi:hypothetical protein